MPVALLLVAVLLPALQAAASDERRNLIDAEFLETGYRCEITTRGAVVKDTVFSKMPETVELRPCTPPKLTALIRPQFRLQRQLHSLPQRCPADI